MMSRLAINMFKTSPNCVQYHRKKVMTELLEKTFRRPPSSRYIPRRVTFYADEGWELMNKPPPSSVATYNPRSYDASTDAFEGLLTLKTRAQIDAEELVAWEELKSKCTNPWRPKRTAKSPGPKLTKTDEELAFEEISFNPLDIKNLPGLSSC